MSPSLFRVFVATLVLTNISALFAQTQPPGPLPKRHRDELVFVANQSANTVSAYQIKSNGGLLPVPGSPFPAGGAPNSIAVVPSGRFAYVADVIPGGITAFSVAHSGALTPLSGSPFSAPTGTASLTIDPSGRFLYALNCGANCSGTGNGNINSYAIDEETGSLTPIGPAVNAGQYPYSLAVEPAGQFAYVASAGSGEVFSYTIDSHTGALTQIGSPIASGNRPIFIVVEPWGQYVYAANTGSNNISGFSINFDGSLSVVAGSPFAASDFTAAIAASRNGHFLIVPTGPGSFVYDVTDSGALITVPGSPFAGGGLPNDVAINTTDGFAYVVNRSSNDVSAYRFNDKKGTLIPVAGSPFPAGSFAAAITSAPAPTR
ncbi:MAG: beta-propeller fold lactonase family protein [Acidobacteria bacterium]|nr:beta-propeller fold lactonase family protein [Acidobacteriota bacterium]